MTTRPSVQVLERDPAVAASLVFALRLEGFEVEVHAGPEALEASLARSDADCLLLDADHPAVSPVDLMSRVRAKGYAGPAIFTATNPPRRLIGQIRASDARLVEKPWTGEGLMAEIRRGVASRETLPGERARLAPRTKMEHDRAWT